MVIRNHASMSPEILEQVLQLDPVIKKLCTICGSPGVSVGVAYGGEVIHQLNHGYTDIQEQLPTQSDSIYAIGTLAKAFTASAIGILVDEGRIKWETPVKDVLPTFQSLNATVANETTVLDLLSHRTGISRSNLWWLGSDSHLLLSKDKLLTTFGKLEPTGSFRGSWGYSNWGYSVVGEIIEHLTGQTYQQFMHERIFKPLKLKSTTSRLSDISSNVKFARPYAALDDASLHPLPPSPIQDGTIMVPAMGLYSTPEDLMTYSLALLQSLNPKPNMTSNGPSAPVLREVLMQLSGQAFVAKSITEKSYALGFYRTQLPGTIAGMGCNGFHVKSLPRIVPGVQSGPLIAHAGSVPGYSSCLAILPELGASIVVCTNSIGLGDASGWITMALIEILTGATKLTDFVIYAKEAAQNHANSILDARKKLERVRIPNTEPKPLHEYIGQFRDEQRDWILEIREIKSEGRLEVAFQGLQSQVWPLTHFEHDTFLWMTDRNEQAKRGRVTTYVQVDSFKLIFGSTDDKIDRLYWPQEAGLSLEKQCFWKCRETSKKL